MRVKLEYERTSQVTEKGWVEVEVGDSTSIADVYKKAHTLDFTQYLAAEIEHKNEEWEFRIVRPAKDTSNAS